MPAIVPAFYCGWSSLFGSLLLMPGYISLNSINLFFVFFFKSALSHNNDLSVGTSLAYPRPGLEGRIGAAIWQAACFSSFITPFRNSLLVCDLLDVPFGIPTKSTHNFITSLVELAHMDLSHTKLCFEALDLVNFFFKRNADFVKKPILTNRPCTFACMSTILCLAWQAPYDKTQKL